MRVYVSRAQTQPVGRDHDECRQSGALFRSKAKSFGRNSSDKYKDYAVLPQARVSIHTFRDQFGFATNRS